jgi:hypothetical protein
MNQLVSKYDEDITTFGTQANKAIKDHFAGLKPSTSKIDSARLGPRSVFISKLRKHLIDKASPYEVENEKNHLLAVQKEFNNMTLPAQLKFQMQSRKLDNNQWVHNLEVLPQNIADIVMSDADIEALVKLRSKVDTTKLREENEPIDVGALEDKLLPALSDPKASLNATICALLLVTGRRTIEIIKTAEFYLGPGMESSGYTCMFKGQAKESLFGTEDFQIPLLAQFSLVHAALKRVQKVTFPEVENVSTDAVNLKYARGLNNYLRKATGMPMAPHFLRTVYAMSCYKLLKGKRSSIVGYVSKILGQSSSSNAQYYLRTEVENVKLWTDDNDIEDEDEDEDEDGWIINSLPERKRLNGIFELMMHKQKVTASAVRTISKGSMPVIEKVIANNQAKIDEYNESLE